MNDPHTDRGAEDSTRESASVVPITPDLTSRMGSILESVQREADRILDEAREEAKRASSRDAPEPGTTEEPEPRETQALRAAMQMAAVGCTRAQVESHLRAYVRLAEPAPVLDRVYGMGTAGDARVRWAMPPG